MKKIKVTISRSYFYNEKDFKEFFKEEIPTEDELKELAIDKAWSDLSEEITFVETNNDYFSIKSEIL